MDLMKLLQASGQQDQILGMLGKQFGLDTGQLNQAIPMLLGALTGGMQKNATQNGVQPLLNALMKGNHQQVLDNPEQLMNKQSEGNAILGHILGNKDVSRAVAGQVQQKTNIESTILKTMMPVIAMVAMGILSKNLKPSNSGKGGISSAAGLLGVLGSLAGNKNSSLGSMASILGGALGGKGVPNKSGLNNLLGMLDTNQDGNPLDEIMGMLNNKTG